MKCEACDGRGQTDERYERPEPNAPYVLVDWDICRVCNGTGTVEVAANGELV